MTTRTHSTNLKRSFRPLVGILGVGVLVVALAGPATASARAPFARGHSSVTHIGLRRLGAAAATCPKVPVTPKTSSAYKLDGQTWNPADTINWTIDTRNISAKTVPARVVDIKRALADATRVTGFKFDYKGRVTSKLAKPPPFLIQFGYVTKITGKYAGSLGEQTNLYLKGKTKKQTIDADITLLSSLAAHYGYYDSATPTSSPEGDVLLHEVAAVLGLENVPISPPEVMSSRASTSTYFLQYQAGDNYGLYKVGASQGCSGYLGIKS